MATFLGVGAVHHVLLSSLEHEIKREDDRVRKVFQDPTGAHLLISMKSKECYYIGQASRRPQPRLIPKVKGQVIESVAWNKLEMSEQNGGTGAILLGTTQGKSKIRKCRSQKLKLKSYHYDSTVYLAVTMATL